MPPSDIRRDRQVNSGTISRLEAAVADLKRQRETTSDLVKQLLERLSPPQAANAKVPVYRSDQISITIPAPSSSSCAHSAPSTSPSVPVQHFALPASNLQSALYFEGPEDFVDPEDFEDSDGSEDFEDFEDFNNFEGFNNFTPSASQKEPLSPPMPLDFDDFDNSDNSHNSEGFENDSEDFEDFDVSICSTRFAPFSDDLVPPAGTEEPPSPPMSDDDQFACQDFYNDCRSYIRSHPETFPNDSVKIRFVMSHMVSGHTGRWANQELGVGQDDALRFANWADFAAEFRKLFMSPHVEDHAAHVMETNHYFQGNQTVSDYLEYFRDLIDDAGITDPRYVVVKF